LLGDLLLVDASSLSSPARHAGGVHEVTKRIEKLSKAEHDMLREVHPNVEKIKESVKDVADAVSAEDSLQTLESQPWKLCRSEILR
jgi:hypothetical protein